MISPKTKLKWVSGTYDIQQHNHVSHTDSTRHFRRCRLEEAP